MAKKDFSNRLHDAVENYYHYNPDTLMPKRKTKDHCKAS